MRATYSFLVLIFITLCSCGNPNATPKVESSNIEKRAEPELHYTLVGNGGVALVFVHGWCINGEYWAQQVARFKPHYRVLTLDLAGHGKSPRTHDTITIANYADDVVRLLNKLQLDSIILIGHSMSGNINLRVYQQVADKVIGFIGVDNLQVVGHQPSEQEAKPFTELMGKLRQDYKGVVGKFAESYLFHPATDSAVKQRVIADFVNADPAVAIPTLENLSKEYSYEREMLPKLNVPLLLIATEKSIQDESSLKQYCPNGYKYWLIKNSGHYPMIEQPEEFNRLLDEAIEYAQKTKF